MPKARNSDITGDLGAHLAAAVLAPISTVETRGETMELDFYCELRAHAGCAFHVQAKGSLEPTYADQMINALPVKRSTVERYWLEQPYPVYLLMSDVRKEHTYYQKVSRDNYPLGNSKTVTFKIPMANRVTTESIGLLVEDILKSQPHMNSTQAIELAEAFKASHLYICHDLDHLQSLLEIMRGSDQHAKVEAKTAIKTLVARSGRHPQSLEYGLLEIFRNCKDPITQSHVLDVLVAIDSKAAFPEVIKQIDRNTRLYDFANSEPYLRHRYTSFLFQSLVRLPPGNLKQDIKRLLRHPDPNVLNGALWLCGQLRLASVFEDIISLLMHSNASVRGQVSEALSQFPRKTLSKRIETLFGKATVPEEIATIIRIFEATRQFRHVAKISALKSHSSPVVRSAVASYLGAEGSGRFISELIELALDEDACVTRQASRGFQLSSETMLTKEALLIPRIHQALLEANELELTLLLELLQNNASERSTHLLIDVFRASSGAPKEYIVFDHEEGLQQTVTVELKAQALSILSGFAISEIYEDIAACILNGHQNYVGVYLQVAADKKIDPAFRALTTLSEMRIEDIGSLFFSTLRDIDPVGAVSWGHSRLLSTKSAFIFAGCIELLEEMHVDCEKLTFLPSRIEALFSIASNRAHPYLYPLISRFSVLSCAYQIVDDLRASMYHGLPLFPGYQMIETLAKLNFGDGHQILQEFLKVAEPHYRSAIIESLHLYRPEIGIRLAKQYRNDEEPEVRDRCETLLAVKRVYDPVVT